MAIQDIISELDLLQADGLIASYAIGGAVAAQAYIAPMSTEDVDVFVAIAGSLANSLAPLTLIYPALIARGAVVSGPYLEIGGWPVQFLLPSNPLYEHAIAHARILFIAGSPARVMGPEHLAAIALQTGRPKDHLRLLEFLNTAVIDQTILMELVERFELSSQWRRFQLRFLTTE